MPRFFIEAEPVDGLLTIEGADARHIARVLRMGPGESLVLCNGAGVDFDCVIEQAGAERILCRVRGQSPSASEPRTEVTLYMALPKADKMELVIQKTIELGVSRIVPFSSARCVARPDASGRKALRWQKIAAEAAKQCGRGRIPEVAGVIPFEEAVREAALAETALFFYECERERSLRGVLQGRPLRTVSLMIGAEGGFSLEEAREAGAGGLISVSLGKRILRCETAPLAALAAVMYESGNLE